MRLYLVAVAELLCVAAIGFGLAMIYLPLAFIVPGALLLVYLQRF